VTTYWRAPPSFLRPITRHLSLGTRRYSEQRAVPGDDVTVVGRVTERGDGVDPLSSDRPPRQTFFRMAKTSLVGLCIGVFVVALGPRSSYSERPESRTSTPAVRPRPIDAPPPQTRSIDTGRGRCRTTISATRTAAQLRGCASRGLSSSALRSSCLSDRGGSSGWSGALVRVPVFRTSGTARLVTDADPGAVRRAEFEGETPPPLAAFRWGSLMTFARQTTA